MLFEYARSKSSGGTSQIVDKVLGFGFFADADVVHAEDHVVVVMHALCVEDLLNSSSLPVVIP